MLLYLLCYKTFIMSDWKEIFKRQVTTVRGMRRIFKDDTEKQKVLTRSDAIGICEIAIIQTYKRLIEKTNNEVIKKELEEFMDEDTSALGM